MKPDPEIYYRTLSRLGVNPREVTFIGDRLPNILGARQLGMHAIQHAETGRTIKDILRLLQSDEAKQMLKNPTGLSN